MARRKMSVHVAGKRRWAQKAEKRMERKGTKGSMTRMAKKEGMSPMAFAKAHYNSPGKVGAKARFAVNINKKKKGRSRKRAA